MMMKVCFITPNLLPVPNVKGGAIESIMTNVIQEQEKNNKLNMTVVSIYDKDAFLASKNYSRTNFIYIKKNYMYIIYSIIFNISNKFFKTNYNTYNHLVLKKIKKKDFDYVIVEGGHYESYVEYLKYFEKDKMVLHLHHQCHSNKSIDRIFSKLIGVSNYVIEDFKKTSKIEKYFLLKNAISISNFDKDISLGEKNKIRSSLGIDMDDFTVIYCGRLIKEKGVLELIKAVKKINNKKIKLIVVGSINFANGGNDSYTNKLNEEVKDSDKIILTGYVQNNELYKYYKISDVMVIPSIWEEAAGLVCIEGMICKKPIITTGIGGIKEYVSNNSIILKKDKNFIKNIELAILSLYDKREELGIIGEENYKVALKYNKDIYYNNLVKMIEEDFYEK